MVNKILKSILTVVAATLLASLVIVTGVLYQYFGGVQRVQLRDELSLAADATQELGEAYLEGLETSNYRLTWVAEDGTVLFDNEVNADGMENHADREEIKEAFATGRGSSSRYSMTLTRQNIYEAVRLADGSVLRISESRVTVVALVLGMLQPIVLLVIFAVAVSAWLAKRMANRVVEPLNTLNLDKPLENEVYEELTPLLYRIHTQQREIRSQMKMLQRKQDEFDQITNNMKEALVLLDHTGRVVSMNPAASILFDTEDWKEQDFLTIDRRQTMQTAIEEAKLRMESSFHEERRGREYQFALSSIVSNGKSVGIVILAFDVTEQMNAEKNRREFTANVSHELKTPLQSIIGSTELLENGIVKQEDTPRFIGHIRKEASRLVSLIDDIIRLSQLDEGADMPQEEVSLHLLSEEVCETLADAARLRDVSLEVSGDEGRMMGVQRLLYEVVYNLCDNAIKYNHVGGSVKAIIEDKQDMVCLKIEDTGIGIAPEEQEKVFERFYRVDKSHSKKSGGTGLGLSIVKHGVAYHHGEIQVESSEGKGTTITVLFVSDTVKERIV